MVRNHKIPAASRPPAPVSISEISPRAQLKDYEFFDRLRFLHRNPGAQFLPTIRGEVGDAFRLMFFNLRRGETTRQVLEKVLGHQEAHHVERPIVAVESIIANYASYASQSKHDMRMLGLLRNEVAEHANTASPTTTLADILRYTPAHSGPGQLVRYLDLKTIAENGSAEHLDFDPFHGEIRKNKIGGKGVIDPYTARVQPSDERIAVHMGEVLESIFVDQAEPFIVNAFFDQQARLKFWEEHLREAGRDVAGNPIVDNTVI